MRCNNDDGRRQRRMATTRIKTKPSNTTQTYLKISFNFCLYFSVTLYFNYSFGVQICCRFQIGSHHLKPLLAGNQ